jgi:RNA polymerase sigma-70 factor (ECF subfamily)
MILLPVSRRKQLSAEQAEQFNKHVYESYHKVYRLAFRLSGNKWDAEDLTQEAFCRAYRNYKDYEENRSFENWIARILTRLFLDMLRKRARSIVTVSYDVFLTLRLGGEAISFDVQDTRETPEENLLRNVFSEEVAYSLSRISQSQRILVFMADIMQLSYKEIARFFGIPAGTVRSRLHRTHKQLREFLQ